VAAAVLTAGFALAAGSVALRGPVPRPPPPPPAARPGAASILLVSVDTLRADHLGLYGYRRATSPRIDAWFASGRVYDSAYSTEASTAPSLVSLLTGLLPQQHGVRLLYQRIPDATETVAERLRRAGYQTAAVVSSVVLTAEALGLDARFEHYDDHVDEPEPRRPLFERRASRTTDAALAWLLEGRDPRRPHFLWVHYIDPHGPYRPPPERPVDFTHPAPSPLDLARVPDYQREPGVDDAFEYVDRYDEEIAYTDREVGRLLDGYARLGLTEGSLVVFTADHGESMLEHEQWFTHGYHVYEEITRVPLALRGPGIAMGRVAHPVSLADVAPTLLRAAGAAVPEGLFGRPLDEAGPDRAVYAEASGDWSEPHQWRAQWRGRGKWCLRVERSRSRIGRVARLLLGFEPFLSAHAGERRYYDLATDPHELRARPWSDAAAGAALLELVRSDPDPAGLPRRFDRGQLIDGPKVAPGADAEALAALRALGYVR
jgi:arylsulfatase